jgi:sulfite reductase (NADPH) hemoprotein beta-component
VRLKTGLRRVVEQFRPEVRLTPSQNILLVNIAAADVEPIRRVLSEHGVEVDQQASRLRSRVDGLSGLADVWPCVGGIGALLARASDPIGSNAARNWVGEEEIIIRMTGCPNGCVRPYMAEIGFVGRAPGRYQIYLGGNEGSTRLNRLFRDTVKDPDIMNELRPVLTRYAGERRGGERFGDWCARVLWAESESGLSEPSLLPHVDRRRDSEAEPGVQRAADRGDPALGVGTVWNARSHRHQFSGSRPGDDAPGGAASAPVSCIHLGHGPAL